MPILNEGDFWNSYGQKDNMLGASKVSLLVLQAMLFAASAVCNTVSYHDTSSCANTV
jgi:hypothetical protein